MATYYVTKDCLTQGIFKLELNQCESRWSNMASGEIMVTSSTIGKYKEHVTYFIDKECFLDKQDAIDDANKRRDKAIESAKKKIAKLEQLEFRIED